MAKIRTKARALDMLGRQQIAGIPTALSELFKNAHDAYAENVEVDYIRKKNLLILRDDGLGMTRQEFEERWLTIGTDSKFEDEDSLDQPTQDISKAPRQVMGEKGIGRLAIAAIGPQVLVITRAKRDDTPDNLVVAFVNWTLFSLPALDLDDIDVPIIEKTMDEGLTKEDIDLLLSQAKENIRSLHKKISEKKIISVCNQVESFSYDPELWTQQLNNLDKKLELPRDKLQLAENGFGTHFIISPVDEVLPEDIEQKESSYKTDQSSKLEKALLGFTNTMKEGERPLIVARFRDHTFEGGCIDRISESIFFTPNEFKQTDHHFKGVFNEFGQFKGAINIYGEGFKEIVVPWSGSRNTETLCGSFEINLAYVQGTLRDSKIAPDLWSHLYNKTSKIGGLYIYRDGIRVLPYGDSEKDFLRIELRRSKSASLYYFSYRNMLGYIDLTRHYNHNLQEKAGREGFIENKAYKQFRDILENFFIKVAEDYFNEKGDLSDLFIEKRSRYQENYLALKKRQKLKSTKKSNVKANLEKFFNRIDDGLWVNGISSLKKNLQYMFDEYDETEVDFDDFVFEIQEYLNSQKKNLLDPLKINIPAGIGFGKEITDWIDRYEIYKREIEEGLAEVEGFTEKKLAEFEDIFGNRTGLRRRFNDSLEAQQEFQRKQLNHIYKEAEESIASLVEWAEGEIKADRIEARNALDKVREEFASTSFSGKSSEELYQLKSTLESKIENNTARIMSKVEELTSQINAANVGTDENALSSGKLTAALESEYEHLKEQHDSNMEMVQLGMALGVVHHEFNTNIITIRRGLKELRPWATKNKPLKPIYDKIRVGFDHLDGYLRTFTPLARRLSRRKTDITGRAISEFVTDVFSERLEKENTEVVFTPEFIDFKVKAFTSTLYPAFVNLIDNAIYWVAKSSGERCITLDADDDSFIISDSGPGIPTIDGLNVFEFGFSKRLGGRGMGLYVAKQTLENDGFTIALDDYSPSVGAVFRISPDKD